MASPISRSRSRARGALSLAAAVVAMQCIAAPGVAFAQAPPDAKTSLANGDKAARAKDWPKALAEYEAANKTQPSADALEGVANAHYQQKNDAQAYFAYAEWKRTYGDKAPKPKQAAVDARIKELEGRTGELTLSLEDGAAGATVTIDDKPAITAGPPSGNKVTTRLPAGPHRVRVTKDGFASFDQVPSITAGQATNLAVKLEALSSKGRLSVKEKTGKPIRVIVDGVDMGDAPWTGEVEAGQHDVGGRGAGLSAAPEKVAVERGKTRDVELVASASTATLKISTNDGKGLVYLDGKLVGEGTFTGDVPSGAHTIRITRDGYDPFEEQLELKEKDTLARSVTLKLVSKIETGEVKAEGTRLEGIYGGFGLLFTTLPSGMGHTMEKDCAGVGGVSTTLTGCDGEGGAIGGGLNGFIGYHWDPVGVELFVGAQYDHSAPTLTWGPSSLDTGFGPDPARTEEFGVHRAGGFGIARVRYTAQGDKLRFSVAAGMGLSYRVMALTRDTTAASNPQFRDVFVPDTQNYLSPVISLEPSLSYRIGAHTAVSLGLSMMVESPNAFDQVPRTNREGGHRLGPSGLNTPAYELATGTQFFFGPFIGMMFGP